jgi:hypothetical protein
VGDGGETNKGTTSLSKQEILNKQEQKAAAREELGKHVQVAMDKHARTVPRYNKEDS